MLYALVVLLGVVLTAAALLRKKAYLAGVGAYSTVTFAMVWPAYHFGFNWSTLWLPATVVVLIWALSSRNTLSRIALIVSAGTLTVLTLGAGNWVFIFIILAAILAVVEGVQRKTQWKILAATAVAVATFAAALSGNLVAPTLFGTAAAAEQPGDATNLTIKPGDLLPDAAKCSTDEFIDNSRKPVEQKGRLWVDSVSTPFTATSKTAQFTELTREICGNPTLGDAYAQALGDAKIGDFSILNANTWLGDFLKKSNSENGLKVWLAHKGSDTKTIYVTADYQSNAQMVNTLLYMLDNQGAKTSPSTVNWPLGALVADTLPRVYKETLKNKQEDKPYMALTYTQKSGGCPYVLAVNLSDKRPENVSCEVATEVAPKTPTKPRLTVTPPGKATSTPTATPSKPGHTPTPTPTPSYTKPPKSCPPGQTGTPPNCLEVKDPKPIPTNSNHTPAGHPSEPASSPSHPSDPAKPTKPGSGSTQTAPGASTAPKPSTPAPTAGTSNKPSSPATGCVDPDTGKAC